MFKIRPRDERGKTKTKWLDSYHSFSFADYYDEHNMGFGDLRVINDDIVEPQKGFGPHHHENMEIISIVINGELEHKDSMGSSYIIKRGGAQRMSAGTGVIHSEMNPSTTTPVHFLQIWLFPDKKDVSPEYEQKIFEVEEKPNKLHLLVSPTGKDNSFIMHQDVEIYQAILEQNQTIEYELAKTRKVWIQIAQGAVNVNSDLLEAGDGLAISNEEGKIKITGIDEKSNLILFNLK